MSATPRSRRICEPTPISTRRRSASAFLGLFFSLPCAIQVGHRLGLRIADQHDHAAALRVDHAHRLLDQRAGRALGADAEQVGQRIDGVHAHQHRAGGGQVALDQRQVLDRLRLGLVDMQLEGAAVGRLDAAAGDPGDDAVVLQAVADQVLDGADLEAVPLGEGDEVRHARHGAVVVHDLADDAGRVETGQPRQVDARLRVAGADQHAALARDQREHVAGRDDVVVVLGGVDGGGDGAGAVVRGDAGGDAFARLDRDREGRAVARLVLARHVLEAQLVGALLGQRQADQAAPVLGHEVDGVGRRHLRGDDQVALVLAVLGVDQDDHAAVAQVVDDLVDRRQEALAFRVFDPLQAVLHR